MFDTIKGWLWLHGKMLVGIFISTMLLKAGGIFGKIFGSLGLAFVTYTFVMPEVKAALVSYASVLDPDIYDLFAYCKVDVCMVMIISAGATKLASNLFLGKAGL